MSNDVWEMIPFASAVEVMSDEGKRLKQRDYLEQGNIPVIDQGEAFIGGYTNDNGMAYKGELPVIIFGDHTRRIKLVNKPFAVGADGVKILKPKPFYRPKFLYYFLQSLEIPSRGYSRHFQFLRNFEFVKTTTEEQDRVVAEIEKQFSRLDESVASLKRVQANLKRYKAAVLKAAVEGKLTEQWRKDHPVVEPADQLLKRILAERRAMWEVDELAKMKAKGIKPKDDSWKKKYKEPAGPDTANMPELPEGWVWASPVQLDSGEAYATAIGPFGSNLKVSDYRTEGVPLIFVRNIRSMDFTDSKNKYIDVEKSKELRPHLARPGDILITKMGEPPGDATCYPEGKPVAVITADCLKLTLSSLIERNRGLFVHAINSEVVKRQIANITQGVAQQKISLARFSQIGFPLPPNMEQTAILEEIDRRLSVTEELETTIEINLKRAERLRQTILRQAFLGGK